MKSYISTVIVFLLCFAGLAQTNSEKTVLAEFEKNHTGIVSRSDKLAVVYRSSPDSSQPIYVELISTTNVSSLLYILRPEYEFRFSAFSESGEAVELTHKGAKYGRHFDDLKTVDRDAIAMNNRGTPMRNIAIPPGSWIPLGTPMFTPDELFNFNKPGKYTMTIEAACFASRDFPPRPMPPATNYYLVKFPPVKIQVVKKEVVK